MSATFGSPDSSLSAFERAVLDKLLTGDSEVLFELREQASHATVTGRDNTEVGFYTSLELPPDAPVSWSGANFYVSGVAADMEGLEVPASFVVFVKDGRIVMLEGVTLGPESWPATLGRYRLYFIDEPRHLELPSVDRKRLPAPTEVDADRLGSLRASRHDDDDALLDE
jgi:hypothetical protein